MLPPSDQTTLTVRGAERLAEQFTEVTVPQPWHQLLEDAVTLIGGALLENLVPHQEQPHTLPAQLTKQRWEKKKTAD